MLKRRESPNERSQKLPGMKNFRYVPCTYKFITFPNNHFIYFFLQKWVPRFGFKKALAEKEKNWVVEVPGNAKDDVDPIALRKTKKQESVAKNELQRLRNISARMQKSRKKKAKICCWPFS